MSWPKGRSLTIEHRAKLSQAGRGNKNAVGQPGGGSRQGIKMPWRGKARPHSVDCKCRFHTGPWAQRFDADYRLKLSEAAKAQMQRHADGCPCFVCRPDHRCTGGQYTALARKLQLSLETKGIGGLIPEVSFGQFVVDLYDPNRHVAFEADGAYWHDRVKRERPNYYRIRDDYLRCEFGLIVVRFNERQVDVLFGSSDG